MNERKAVWTVEREEQINSLGMAVGIWHIKRDGITQAESRYSDVACAIRNFLEEREEVAMQA